MAVLCVHLALAVGIFLAINWVGKHSSGFGYLPLGVFAKADDAPAFNFLLKVGAVPVLVVIAATVLFAMDLDRFVAGIWIAAPLSYAIRLSFNLVMGRAKLLNYWSLSLQLLAATGLTLIAYEKLIIPRQPLFPSAEEIGAQMWMVIALFVYSVANSITLSSAGSVRRKKRYLLSRINSFRVQFGPIVESTATSRVIELAAYAVLVQEDFNRPKLFRSFERLLVKFRPATVGIMQVRSGIDISDEESVRIGVERLNTAHQSAKSRYPQRGGYSHLRKAIAEFNRDSAYVDEVMKLIEQIAHQVLTEYREDYESVLHRELSVEDLEV